MSKRMMEQLECRRLFAVVAKFDGETGVLRVIGDGGDNEIVVKQGLGGVEVRVASVAAGGGGGAGGGALVLVPVRGLVARVDGAKPMKLGRVVVEGGGGNDLLRIDESGGVLPRVTLIGGAGNDVLVGGSGADVLLGEGGNDDLRGGGGADELRGGEGNDVVTGGTGTDVASLGAGDDVFVWGPGDGSDVVEGEAGVDRLRFDGSSVGENVVMRAEAGGRVRLSRDVGGVVMDVFGTERVDLSMLGGADTVEVGDLTGTDVAEVGVNLGSTLGGVGADGARDVVRVVGTAGEDRVGVNMATGAVEVTGLRARVRVTGGEAARDELLVRAMGGDDLVDATAMPTGVMGLLFDGGDGDDILVGGRGADTLLGGAGDDILQGNDGNDLLDGGLGSDVLIGGAGQDILVNGEVNVQ